MSRLTFGKHRGKLISSIPTDYLAWMVKEDTQMADLAELELKRRREKGDVVVSPDIVIFPDAIDTASLLLHALWKSHPKGIVKWLEETWIDLLNTNPVVSKPLSGSPFIDHLGGALVHRRQP